MPFELLSIEIDQSAAMKDFQNLRQASVDQRRVRTHARMHTSKQRTHAHTRSVK